MFRKIQTINAKYQAIIMFSIVIIAFLINLELKMFLGGLLIVASIVGGVILMRKFYIFLLLMISTNFLFFSWYNQLPIKAIIGQGGVFFTTLIISVFVSEEVKRYIEELNFSKIENCQLTKELILSFVEAIDAKDHYLHNHSYNVCLYSMDIAKEMGYSEANIKEVGLAALLHDIGKISISENILNKPDKLNEEEWYQMKLHASNGPTIINNVKKLKPIINIIKYHHRHYDGSGYPVDIDNELIPIESRIVSLADAFDAMTTDRPYRLAMSVEEAYSELKKYRGSQFHPEVVDAFFRANVKLKPYNYKKTDIPDFL